MPLLAEAASNIGDVQVRNMGTIGGRSLTLTRLPIIPRRFSPRSPSADFEGKGERTRYRRFFCGGAATASSRVIIKEIIVPVSRRFCVVSNGAARFGIRDCRDGCAGSQIGGK
jgi:CO/xanthine dehydrogenase FAD-binding subunit